MKSLPRFQTAIETWTPAMAEKILALQDEADHRPLKKTLVWRYATDMSAGRWILNGETVILNGNRIIDGRHRLTALVEAGVNVDFLVVRGVDASVFSTVDTGGLRSPGDVFHIAGVPNSKLVASAARLCFTYDQYATVICMPETWPTRMDLLDYIRQHEELVETGRWMTAAKERRYLTRPAVMCAIHALCANRPVEREVFFTDLVTGVNLHADAPVRVLRERLLADRGNRLRLTTPMLAAFFIKAWNMELEGRQMRLLRWNPAEPFPLLVSRPPACEVQS